MTQCGQKLYRDMLSETANTVIPDVPAIKKESDACGAVLGP